MKYVALGHKDKRETMSSMVKLVCSERNSSDSKRERATDIANSTGILVKRETTSNETSVSSLSKHTSCIKDAKSLEFLTACNILVNQVYLQLHFKI